MEIVAIFDGAEEAKIVANYLPNWPRGLFVHHYVPARLLHPGTGLPWQSLNRLTLRVFPRRTVIVVTGSPNVVVTGLKIEAVRREIHTFVFRTYEDLRRFQVRVQMAALHLVHELLVRDHWTGKLAPPGHLPDDEPRRDNDRRFPACIIL